MPHFGISCRPIVVDDSYVEVFVDLHKELDGQNVVRLDYSLFVVRRLKHVNATRPEGIIRFVRPAFTGIIVGIEPTAYMELYLLSVNVIGDKGKKTTVELCIGSIESMDKLTKECS